jgi:hypothetical protein
MDATRLRRTRDRARQQWYAGQRQWRFARFMGVVAVVGTPVKPSVIALQQEGKTGETAPRPASPPLCNRPTESSTALAARHGFPPLRARRYSILS